MNSTGRKIQLILAIAAVLLVLLGGYKILSTSKKPTDEIAIGEAEKEEINISSQSAQQIAGRIIDWLDTMKNDKGQYYVYEKCGAESCEKSAEVDKQIGINVVWARYRIYLNNKDQRNFESLEKDLETLTTAEIGFPAQNDFLNCKLMYEMHQTDLFLKPTKDKIDKICIGSIYYGPEMDEYIKTLNLKKYQEEPGIEEVVNGVTLEKWPVVNPNKFTKYAIYASDLTAVYKWIGNDDDLEAAKYYFNMALQLFSDKTEDNDGSVLGLAALDIYSVTKDQKYLDFVDYFISYKESKGCSSLEDCAYYLMFLDEYLQETNNNIAEEEINKILNLLMKNYYDETKGIFYTSETNIVFSTLENSLIAGFLAQYSK